MSGKEQRFQQAMNKGHSAAWDQLWDQAASYYRQALEEFPDHPKALTSLGLALFELQEYKEALEVYQEAARVLPEDPLPLEKAAELQERLGYVTQAVEVYLRAAELYAKNRDVNKAIQAWVRVTRLNPEHLLAHSRLALVYERLGRKEQALVEYLAVASLMQHAGDVAKAVQTVMHALQVAPNSREAGQALSMLQAGKLLPKPTRPRGVTGPLIMAQVRQLEKSKEPDSAKTGRDPVEEGRQRALTTLAEMLFEQDDQEARTARRGLQAIMSGQGGGTGGPADTARIARHIGQLVDLQAQGKTSEAIGQLQKAMEAGLDNPAASFDLGLLYYDTGQLEKALSHLQRAVKHQDFALPGRLLLGQIFQRVGRLKEASVEFLEALKLADSQVVSVKQAEELHQLYEPLIESQSQQTDPALQERVCQNVTEMLTRPDWRDHLIHARQQLPNQMEGEPPVPLAEVITQASGSRLVEAIGKIHQYARAGKLLSAMEEAYYALQYAPTYLPLHTYIGDLLLQEGQTQKASAKFTAIAQSYAARGETGRAIDVYRRIIELSPMDMGARVRLIDSLVALGENANAISEYLNLADVYYNLADLIMARKTYTQALRLAQQSNVDRQWKVKILHNMADIDLQSLDWRQALRVYEQIRTLLPDDEKARTSLVDLNFRLGQTSQAMSELDHYLSFLWNGGRRSHALQFIENLVAENPNQPNLRRRLGDIYRQLGRNEDAIAQLDAAGHLLMEVGDRKGVIETIMAILAMNPPNAADYQQILAQIKSSE